LEKGLLCRTSLPHKAKVKLDPTRSFGRDALRRVPARNRLLTSALKRCARVDSGIKRELGGDYVADRPPGFAIENLDLRVARLFRVSFYNGVSPETAVGRSLNFDGGWGVADVLAIDFDLGTWGLGDNLDSLSGSCGMRM